MADGRGGRRALMALLLAVSIPAFGATFLVPPDRDFVRAAKAIVVATAGESHSRLSPAGRIETVTLLTVEENIAGPLAAGATFEIIELGGVIGDRGLVVPGAPHHDSGSRALLFLDRNARGDWVTKNMNLGRFTWSEGEDGRALLVRDAKGVCGWNYDGTPYIDPDRLAEPFLAYVRSVARGENREIDYVAKRSSRRAAPLQANAATISSYLIQVGGRAIRWNSFPSSVVFFSRGTQPGATGGGVSAAQKGVNAWTSDPNSNIVYQYGGTTTSAGGLENADGVHTIQFNDPNNEIPGAYTGANGDTLAIGGAWFSSTSHTIAGETFSTILEADLVVQNGLSGPGLSGNGFDHVMTHELGHTLGLRHSDDPPSGGTSSTTAIMNSSVLFNGDPFGSTLQAWDLEAINAVYGSGSTCTPPQITSHPKSGSLLAEDFVLSVSATGSAPLQYQWYVGQKGLTVQPVQGGTTPQIAVRPLVTTSYWVRVTNGCNPHADSDAAVVTVNGCSLVLINSFSSSTTIVQGRSTTLSVGASGGSAAVSYQWFAGVSGDTANPVPGATGSSLTVSPTTTTSYWVRVANACGSVAQSDTVTVTVEPCEGATIVVQPAGGLLVAGDTVTLSATVLGTAPLELQWLQDGNAIPNATTSSVSVGPLFNAATFTLRATNLCGDVTSQPAIYAVTPSCVPPSIASPPVDRVVSTGGATTFQVTASGTALTYRWYEGQKFDFTKPVGGSAPALYTGPVHAETYYWLRISNGCGTVDTEAVKVSIGSSRRRGARH